MKTYSLIWRNKWLTAEAKTVDEMIRMLHDAADELVEMQDAGLVLVNGGELQGDYALFETSDPALAKRFGMLEQEETEADQD